MYIYIYICMNNFLFLKRVNQIYLFIDFHYDLKGVCVCVCVCVFTTMAE
jgi:hypothetical protein